MPANPVHGLRLKDEDWQLFVEFKQRLQDTLPMGTVSTREAFVTAVSSASAVLAGRSHEAAAPKGRKP